MRHYGLIGRPLGHSFSKEWFDNMFLQRGIADADYQLYELPSCQGLRQWVSAKGLRGFNVTIPFKQAILPHLDHLTPEAQAIQAVNCVLCAEDPSGRLRLIGHNTDAPAFQACLQPLLPSGCCSALILGTGGAAKAVAHVLRQNGIPFRFVSRNPGQTAESGTIGYAEAAKLAAHSLLIVNCTPVGMHPSTHATPWPFPETITSAHLCFDLIYNPAETLFLQQARHQGAVIQNGLAMLYRQAELSWQFWQS